MFRMASALRHRGCARFFVTTKEAEAIENLRRRLLYQSRKRGTLENDLILGTFASKNLLQFDIDQLRVRVENLGKYLHKLYDKLINGVDNEWDLYYWCVGKAVPPPEVDHNPIFQLLREHVRNDQREKRFRMPDLPAVSGYKYLYSQNEY